MQNRARFLCDTVTVGVAGECIRIVNSSNATFANFDIGFIGDSVLPYPRSEAGNTALLVEDSQNITVRNTTIEHSPGPGDMGGQQHRNPVFKRDRREQHHW